ncbi:hypothetical protein EJB05_33173, partial [Eragrostis curvula]
METDSKALVDLWCGQNSNNRLRKKKRTPITEMQTGQLICVLSMLHIIGLFSCGVPHRISYCNVCSMIVIHMSNEEK